MWNLHMSIQKMEQFISPVTRRFVSAQCVHYVHGCARDKGCSILVAEACLAEDRLLLKRMTMVVVVMMLPILGNSKQFLPAHCSAS